MFLNGYNDGIKKLRLNIYIGKTKTILCQLEFNNIPNKDFQKEKNGRPVICNGISIGFFSEIKVSYLLYKSSIRSRICIILVKKFPRLVLEIL